MVKGLLVFAGILGGNRKPRQSLEAAARESSAGDRPAVSLDAGKSPLSPAHGRYA